MAANTLAKLKAAEHEASTLRARVAELEAALKTLLESYGEIVTDWSAHDEECQYSVSSRNECSCGFHAALKRYGAAENTAFDALCAKAGR